MRNTPGLCAQPATFSQALGTVHRFAQEQQRTQAELPLQLPKPYEYFSAEQCSTISTNHAPPQAGLHTVYLRESEFAHELTFEP